MTTNAIPQPSARTFSIYDLVEQVRRGRIRIPEFQRPLRWQWEDVRRLFDSIVKGYPIGNLLLWQRDAPAGRLKLGALEFDGPALTDAWWVVDGQQRLLSLANALDERGARNSRFALSYDLKDGNFTHPPEHERGDVIPLPVLFDLRALLRWFADHPDAGDHLDDASQITKSIREFSIPAYVVEQKDEAILRDIFDRMNNYGRRLSRAEVFSALHPGAPESTDIQPWFGRIADVIDADRGFGKLDDDTILRAVLARRGGDVTREIRHEFKESALTSRDFGKEAPEAAYREGEIALRRAVAFLQDEAGVPHFAFLPYRYLLVVLARFFALFPDPARRNRDLLRRWFWRAAMVGPVAFSGSWTHAMRTLATRVEGGDESGSVQRLLDLPDHSPPHPPRLTDFRTNAAAARIVLCALWSLGPRSFSTGSAYTGGALAEAISPDGTPASVVDRIFRHEPEGHRAWAANRVFVLDELPRGGVAESLTNPNLIAIGDWGALLASHALDDAMVGDLAKDEKVAFLDRRQGRIRDVVGSFLSRMAEQQFEDTPPLDTLDLDGGEPEEEARDDAAS